MSASDGHRRLLDARSLGELCLRERSPDGERTQDRQMAHREPEWTQSRKCSPTFQPDQRSPKALSS
jgi:hypothetical protein